ncbi:MAG TPA: class II aldolase/adducin family protein [Longimicrobiales bacterium]|nr:class II aldolase/adducin family protein [Longimicrobiales bacterium]
MSSAKQLRRSVVGAAREMSARGLSQGTSGNVSARAGADMLITPSALPYATMEPRDAVLVDPDGRVLDGARKPSTEWPMHAAIYRARPDADAVVHAHAPFCTTLATLRKDIPPFHYMVAVAGGDSIRCAPYATFGTPELGMAAVAALRDRRACLLANHGMVALGSSPEAALQLAVEVEALAELFWRALQVAEPARLDAGEMAEALARFRQYR